MPMLPLLLLLAAPISTLASIPPDPFAHPKYKLSFLNDLPIETSLAERWIASGLPHDDKGGVGVFFGDKTTKTVDGASPPESERIGIEEEGEVEQLVGGGDDAELDPDASPLLSTDDQTIIASPASDLSPPQNESPPKRHAFSASNFTLQHLLLPPGPRAYLCLLPPPPPPLSDLPPPPPVPPMDPALPAKLLKHLDGTCLYMKQGWFTYAYCHGKEIKQFREAARPWPPAPGGFVPKIDDNYDDYTLGRAAADLNADQNLPPIALGRGAGQRYLVQRWGGGTVCDKTARGREIEVQFHCSMTGTDNIGLIKEVSTCNYILMINTPRLCNIPGFSSTHLSEAPSGINCREIVPDGSIPKAEIESDASKTSTNRTPLPSWAILPPSPPKHTNNPNNLNSKATPLTPKPVSPAGGLDAASPEIKALLQRVLAQMTGTIPLGGGGEDADADAAGVILGVGEDGQPEGVVHLRVEHDLETGEMRVVPDSTPGTDPYAGVPTYNADGQLELDYNDYSSIPGHEHEHGHHAHPLLTDDEQDEEEDRRYEEELEGVRGVEGKEREKLERDLEEEEREDGVALRRFEERIRRRREAREGWMGVAGGRGHDEL